MLIKRENLVNELNQIRVHSSNEITILDDVKSILSENQANRDAIQKALKSESSTISNDFKLDMMETDKIYHIDHIKSLCVTYRLRFLDSQLFKPEIPEEAISKIRFIEQQHHTKLEGFKIIAPSKLFHLKNYDDPILFAPIGNGYYYLIHKWGNDMSATRKWLVKPFKNMINFGWLLFFLSIFITAIIPDNILGNKYNSAFHLISFLFIFKSFAGISLYYCFWKGKNFNENIWNRAYYN
jgi:hypothetical protein